MKKILVLAAVFFAAIQFSNAQIHWGLKGGVNYNSDSFVDVKDDVLAGAESKTGFHFGTWVRVKVPVLGVYVRPELVYTNLKNDVLYKTTDTKTSFTFQKIDIPVLIGKKFLKVANVFVGPSFQYVIDSDFGFDDIKNVKGDGFTVGMQLGAGVELGRLGVDVRWERGFNDVETSAIGNVTDNVNFDTRVNQIIVGLSFRM